MPPPQQDAPPGLSSAPLLTRISGAELQPCLPLPRLPAAARAPAPPPDDALLKGHAEAGALRAATGASGGKFHRAARRVFVTTECMHMLQAAASELREAQQHYGASASGPSPPPPGGGGSVALAASSALGDGPTKAAADWGRLQGLHRLVAAPAAAAARQTGVEQPYLSHGRATKAAHEAWQPGDDPQSWRQLLGAKKAAQANRGQAEEAQRQQAASFIQATWRLHCHKQRARELQEQQLTGWAHKHHAAAQHVKALPPLKPADAAAAAVASALAGSIGREQLVAAVEAAAAAEVSNRRGRAAADEAAAGKRAVVQPFARQVGRNALLNSSTAAALPAATGASSSSSKGPSSSKWRGAAHGAVAASKLASVAAGDHIDAAHDASSPSPAAAEPSSPPPPLAGDAHSSGRRASLPAGGSRAAAAARTSSTAGGLSGLGSRMAANLASLLHLGGASAAGSKGPAIHEAAQGAAAAGNDDDGGDDGGGGGVRHVPAAIPPSSSCVAPTRLASLDWGFFRRGSASTCGEPPTAVAATAAAAARSSSKCAPSTRGAGARHSLDLGMLPGSSRTAEIVTPAADRADDHVAHHERAAGEHGCVAAPVVLEPAVRLQRRGSVEVMFGSILRRLARASSSLAHSLTGGTRSSSGSGGTKQAGSRSGGGGGGGGGGDRGRIGSIFGRRGSLDLGGFARNLLRWRSTELPPQPEAPAAAGSALAYGWAAADLQARGAAAASRYLQAAQEAVAEREAVLSLCGGMSATRGLAEDAQASGVDAAGVSCALAPRSHLGSSMRATDAEAAEGFDGMWTRITGAAAATASGTATAAAGAVSSVDRLAAPAASHVFRPGAPAPSAPPPLLPALAVMPPPAASGAAVLLPQSGAPAPPTLLAPVVHKAGGGRAAAHHCHVSFQPPRLLLNGDVLAAGSGQSSANSSGKTTPTTNSAHAAARSGSAADSAVSSLPASPTHAATRMQQLPLPPAAAAATGPHAAQTPQSSLLLRRQPGLKAKHLASEVHAAMAAGPPSAAGSGCIQGRSCTVDSSSGPARSLDSPGGGALTGGALRNGAAERADSAGKQLAAHARAAHVVATSSFYQPTTRAAAAAGAAGAAAAATPVPVLPVLIKGQQRQPQRTSVEAAAAGAHQAGLTGAGRPRPTPPQASISSINSSKRPLAPSRPSADVHGSATKMHLGLISSSTAVQGGRRRGLDGPAEPAAAGSSGHVRRRSYSNDGSAQPPPLLAAPAQGQQPVEQLLLLQAARRRKSGV